MSSALSKMQRLAQLPGTDRLLLVEAWLRLALTMIALKTIGFRRLMRFTPAKSEQRSTMPEGMLIAQRVSSIERAAKYQFRPAMCLPRSVVLHQWLRQSGISNQLRIGVQKIGQRFAAHAWIEVDGTVVYESTDVAARFTPLASADGSSSLWGRP